MKSALDLIVAAGEEKQAQDILILNIRAEGRVLDYMVVMTADSRPQIKAVITEIGKKLKEKVRWQGEVESGWVILDLGSIVVHVMDPEQRAYYNLEDLWGTEAVVYHI